jgi:MoaA/NifB/PqqE/SkfB family radical SAM enzyme
MSVKNCMYPWHWLTIGHDGQVFPCGHGSKPVGNLTLNTAEDIWNGPIMQDLRASLLAGSVHEVCRSSDCPYQQTHLAFTPLDRPPAVDEELARLFDDEWYLEAHADVRAAVQRRHFSSGLEHFGRHGRAEGRAYRLIPQTASASPPSSANSSLALLEYSRGATIVRSSPVDIVLQVSTVCNLRCVMCPHGTGAVERPSHMPMAVLDRVRDFIGTAARMIVSGLGEPLLAPAFWRLIEDCARRNEAFIRANSNGLLVTPANAHRIMDSGLKEISFSLDAATPSTYAKVRGAEFCRALDGIRTLCAARRAHPRRSLEIFINMTLMAENIAEAPAFVALAAELGVDAVLFSQLFPFGNDPSWKVPRAGWTFSYSEQMLHRTPIEAAKHLNEARRLAATLGIRAIFQSNTDTYLDAVPAHEGGNTPC